MRAMAGLAERVAFVGGGASGIGLACARQLAQAGVRVIVADVVGAAEAAALLTRTRGVALDVTDEDAVRAAVAGIEASEDPATLAVNSVGIAGSGQGAIDYGLLAWERMLRVGLTGTMLCQREALRHMGRAGGGSIVNVASVLALHGSAANAAYAAAKHALVGLTKSAAIEQAAAGIRVNVLCPGFIDTPLPRAHAGDRLAEIAARHPIGRLGTADEVAAFAAPSRDLIAYRRRHDRHIEARVSLSFTSRWGGEWRRTRSGTTPPAPSSWRWSRAPSRPIGRSWSACIACRI